MKQSNDVIVGDTGYILYKRAIKRVTVERITDISILVDPDIVFFVEETPGYFRKLLNLNEAQEELLEILEFDRHILEDDKEGILYNLREVNKKIKKLRKEMD